MMVFIKAVLKRWLGRPLQANAQSMNGWIGITAAAWFAFLPCQPGIDEINFLGTRMVIPRENHNS